MLTGGINDAFGEKTEVGGADSTLDGAPFDAPKLGVPTRIGGGTLTRG